MKFKLKREIKLKKLKDYYSKLLKAETEKINKKIVGVIAKANNMDQLQSQVFSSPQPGPLNCKIFWVELDLGLESAESSSFPKESRNSPCEFAGLHLFWVEKLGKFLGRVQFLNIFQ
jgi:hypothetical protein